MNYFSPKKLLKWSLLTAAMSITSTAMASLQEATERMSKDGHGAFVHFIERDIAKVP